MYSSLQLALKYFRYQFTASGRKGHGIHSPFVYEFITQVLNDKRQFDCFRSIEYLREEFRHDPTEITVPDFGAGSRKNLTSVRKISAIAYSSLKPKKYGQLLFRMVHFYKPDTILELGTSLGITTAYLSCANPTARIISLEGAPQIAGKARENFNRLDLTNIEITEGNFDESLPRVINQLQTVSFAFIDGNHRKKPTLDYFEKLLAVADPSTIMVFDDIHWSDEMEGAWTEIKQHPAVTLTIDLFFIGIVFFRTGHQAKQDFTIRF